jgi:hypothetical protein
LSITLQQLNDKSYSHLAQKHRKIVWGWGPTFWNAFSQMQISWITLFSSCTNYPWKKNSNQNAMSQVRWIFTSFHTWILLMAIFFWQTSLTPSASLAAQNINNQGHLSLDSNPCECLTNLVLLQMPKTSHLCI